MQIISHVSNTIDMREAIVIGKHKLDQFQLFELLKIYVPMQAFDWFINAI